MSQFWSALRQVAVLIAWAAAATAADGEAHKVLIRDVASVEGIRNNSLVGYGLVVGLKGTGDKQQTYFTIQTLASILQRMGVEIPQSVIQTTVQVKNVAAVFVTASLPPFSRPGVPLDVTVSSAGDARSLEGGLLLLTPLYAADGQVYASAQGPLVLGGYAVGSATNSKVLNHPNVGRIPGGALVERDSAFDLARLEHVSLLLNDASFSTAEAVAAVINQEWSSPVPVATVVDSRRVDIQVPASGPTGAATAVPALLARIENLAVEVRRRAKVVVNERTGTVVLGQDVRLGAVSILHGNFSIEVSTAYALLQPSPLAAIQTEVVPETKLKATEAPARNVELSEGASVEQLVTRLQAIGATARDVISILQAIKSAGALEAELEVI
ncbi:MAG TPA: flagellar basal body P-ring protein FlgI [Candidatus Sulfotelmatobacter sp.]|nr:flagellar basal body P-ring protein FlgI [Candidatus Sulfotelmatobacter sp.]